jgi:predicted RNA-binding protein YlxR (DUF448 family)
MRGKHIPIRTCLGCGQRKPKEELARIVVENGALMVDKGGKLPGRGAYLCPETACINSLRKKKGRLSYSLRVSVPRAAEDGFLKGMLRIREGEK